MSAQEEFDFNAPPRWNNRAEASAAILDRIKKLLRLAADKRGNAHEAERAMSLAFELAEKYRVDLAALDLDEKSAGLVHEYWHLGERLDRLRRGIFGLLQTYFHVTVCVSKPQMLVIGKPHDVAIAQYVHDFLLRAGRDCLARYTLAEKSARRRVTTAKRAGYISGFIYGVAKTLHGAREAMPLDDARAALVLAEDQEREQKLAELVPRRGDVSALLEGRKNQTALEAGYRDGRRTEINQPLEGSRGATLLLQ